jgi:hypothetical protein
MWLSKDESDKRAWHLTARQGHVEVLRKLWDLAKELQLQQEELRNEMWESKDKSGESAWQMAVGGHVEILEELLDWAK